MRDSYGVLRGECTLCERNTCKEFICHGKESSACQSCGCPSQKHTKVESIPLYMANQNGTPHEKVILPKTEFQKQQNNNSMYNNMAEREQLTDEFISNVTLHGYRYLFVTKGTRRLIWIIFFVAAILLSFFLFFHTVMDYYKYKTFTLTEIDYNIKELDFPTITLCNKNSFIETKYYKFPLQREMTLRDFHDMYEEVIAGTREPSNETLMYLEKLSKIGITTYEELISLFETNHEDIFHNEIALLFHRSDHNKTCTFHGEPCAEEDVQDTMQWRGSLCQSFNFFEPNKQPKNQSGVVGDIGFHNYLNILSSEAIKDTSSTGISVFIHPYGTPSIDEFFIDKVNVHPGVVNRILLEQRKLTLLPPPYGNCGSKEYKIVKHYPYSHGMCHIDCALQYIYDKCGCVGFELKGFVENIPICSIHQMSRCYLREINKAYSKTIPCQDTCLLECVLYKYTIQMDSLNLGTRPRYEELEQLSGWSNKSRIETINYVKENIVGLKIAYRQMSQVREIMTPSVTIINLMGSIGGSIGLGIGLSMLTIVEFIIFIFDYICLMFTSKKKGTNSNI